MNGSHNSLSWFNYDQAFNRNVGWVTGWEQAALRGKTIAIAGMGGVGGIHLLTLARLGVGGFRLADFDRFDIVNFNRQAGATVDTIGRPKLDVMAEMALAINPTLRIERFEDGVTPAGVDAFLDGVDLFVDGFDFFALAIRRQVFERCAQLGIPAVTAAPIGMGVGWLTFMPGGMTFEDYFRLEGQTENEQFLRFLLGVAPRGLHRTYLVDQTQIDLARRKGPSTAAACQLCAGVVGTLAAKILLGRGEVRPAPDHHHFDAYTSTYRRTHLRWGNASPAQRARLALARKALLRPRAAAEAPPASDEPARTVLEAILDAGRWAPSGDNSQPWRFEVVDTETVRVHLASEAGSNPYDYRGGEPTLLSGGMLLETLRVAATQHGREMRWSVESIAEPCRVLVHFQKLEGLTADPLLSVLSMRSVNRRPYESVGLTASEKESLTAVVRGTLTVRWFEPLERRLAFGRLGGLATDIRLRARETFEVHRKVIDWTSGHSATGLPAGAIGLDRATLKVMRWAMGAWSRMERLNRLTGTWAAVRQLDRAPAIGCAAFYTLEGPPAESQVRVATLLERGMAIQRFWLTATRLGLAMQPGLATLIFAQYGEDKRHFTEDMGLLRKAVVLAQEFRAMLGVGPSEVVYLGRIGRPKVGLPGPRSVRRPLGSLIVPAAAVSGG